MIEESIEIHDNYQFEIKLGYKLNQADESSHYKVETFLFLPNSLGINSYSYTKKNFYDDIQAYIRIKTPVYLLNQIASETQSPLQKLRTSIDEMVNQYNDKTIKNFEHHLKMFCCILKSSLRDHISSVSNRQNLADKEDLTEKYLKNSLEIITKFRELRTKLNLPLIEEDTFSFYCFADEYISILVEAFSFDLMEILETDKTVHKQMHQTKLVELISSEVEYRKQNNYPSIPKDSESSEKYLFRSSILKKYTGNVLFLNTKIKQEGELLEQLLFALSAGLAMFFAVIATVYAKYHYSEFSMPVIMILIVSYMFKDRIKEAGRNYFGNKLHNRLYDHKMNIYHNNQEKLGWRKESFTFLKETTLPADIIKLRQREHLTEIENGWVGENIMLYKKEIRLFKKNLNKIYSNYNIESINDILRFNVMSYLKKMDDPQKIIHVLDTKNNTFERIHGKRVYFINMIIKYTYNDEVEYKRYRITLNRDGIRRIDNVAELKSPII
ncbi:MAG: hypothetical protein PF689_10990 [Deltaproteobacteria bacterium]|jgi:hypothetical protein|nr:hypothetical protein [Deltaproteobacteria bacterium]